jgi:hypothetical protein
VTKASGLALGHRSARGLVVRSGKIVRRFGVTQGPFARLLEQYREIAAEAGARPTLPITACVLARHAPLIRGLSERGVEFAIHGLVHNDHASLSLERQRTTIAQAAATFDACGVPYAGFRGPYLRWNEQTRAAVRSLGLRYHSTEAVEYPALTDESVNGAGADALARVRRMYAPRDAETMLVRPRMLDGLVDIPVVLPDDEIMVERLELSVAAQIAAWRTVLGVSHARGELFTLQLHPERMHECADALRTLLADARSCTPAVWLARLDEVADWWLRRDRATIAVEQTAPGRYRVAIEAPDDATVVVRGAPELDADPWYGQDRLLHARTVELAGDVRPVVGVSTRTAAAVRDLLREEGYAVEQHDDPSRVAVHIDEPRADAPETAIVARVEGATGPLVRIWRWPGGARSALSLTGDVDSVTIQDFALRIWETRR